MDFTEIYRQSSSLVAFSPGAHFILAAVKDRVIVRRTDTFQITRTWLADPTPSPTLNVFLSKPSASKKLTCSNLSNFASDTAITHVGWSCDSEYIMAACAKRGVVHLMKLRDEDWSGRIEAGAEGIVKAEWAPDGRTIVCFSEWGLRVSLWSLVVGTATYIQYPVHPDRGYAFSADSRYFVIAERHRSKDTLGVYDSTDMYKILRHFPLPTSSLTSLAISPTGNYIAIWEGPLEYKLHVLTLAGEHLASFSPDSGFGFGIRQVTWHPSGTFIAVAGWDDKIHILNSLNWSVVVTLELTSRLSAATTIWREPSKWKEASGGRGFLSYEKVKGPQSISIAVADQTRLNPASGVIQLEWNTTGSLLLARFERVPYAVHIFNFPSAKEQFAPKLRSILMHTQPVIQARWNTIRKGSLALCCGDTSMYLWSEEWVSEGGVEEEMAECIGVPAKKFETRDLRWAPDGQGLLLIARDQFCCAFEVQ